MSDPPEVLDIDGSGVIDVRGVGNGDWSSECLLRIGGTVTHLDSSAYEGSIGRLVARAANRPPRPSSMVALRELTGMAGVGQPLRDALAPVLDLLAPGRYELRGPEPLWPDIPEHFAKRWSTMAGAAVMRADPDDATWFYPLELEYLVPTEDWPPDDEETVARYRERIRYGARPALIVARGGSRVRTSGFVLDGHHKLAAYLAEGIVPVVVWISRLDAPAITAAELRAAFLRSAGRHREFSYLLDVLDRREGRT